MADPQSDLAGLVVVRIKYIHASSVEFMQTLHCRTGAASANTVAGMTGLATAIEGYVDDTGWQQLLSTVTLTSEVEVQDLSPTHFASVIQASGANGTDSGQAAPIESALVVTHNTGLAGRAFRGRAYMGGAVASRLNTNGTQWDTDYAAAWEAQWEGLYSVIATASPTEYGAVIWHRAAGQGGVPAADTVTPIISATGRIELATQRRRRPGIGQ